MNLVKYLEYVDRVPLPIKVGLVVIGLIVAVKIIRFVKLKRMIVSAAILAALGCIFAGCSSESEPEPAVVEYQIFLPGQIGKGVSAKFDRMLEEARELSGDPTGVIISNTKDIFDPDLAEQFVFSHQGMQSIDVGFAAEISELSLLAEKCGLDLSLRSCSNGDSSMTQVILGRVYDIFGCEADLRDLTCPGHTEEQWHKLMDEVLCPEENSALAIPIYACILFGT